MNIRNLKNGILGGLAGGAVFGMMMTMMGMGLGVNWNLQPATQMLPSLMGHLVFGALLGWVYSWLHDDVRGLAHAQSVWRVPLRGAHSMAGGALRSDPRWEDRHAVECRRDTGCAANDLGRFVRRSYEAARRDDS